MKRRTIALFLCISLIIGNTLPAVAAKPAEPLELSQIEEDSVEMQEILNGDLSLETPEETPDDDEREKTEELPATDVDTDEEEILEFVPASTAAMAVEEPEISPTATARYTMVELNWKSLANADSYNIYRGDTEDNLTLIKEKVTDNKYQDQSVEEDKNYFYRIDCIVADEILEGEIFCADQSTGIDALWETAAAHYAFSGKDKFFDGTRTIDKTEDIPLLKDLSQGTILIKAKYTGAADSNYHTLFGFGNEENIKTKQISMGANGTPFSTRYEFGDGLYSSGMQSVPFSDGEWHIIAFTAGDGYVSVAADGASATDGANGYYNGAKWNGFLTRGILDSFTIGGFSSPNSNKYPYSNWIGEIEFITFTDEVLGHDAAAKVTGKLKNEILEIKLSNNIVSTPETVGTEVGNIIFTGDSTEGYQGFLEAGIRDNDKFSIENNVLKTKEVLEPFTIHTIEISSDAGIEPQIVEIYTSGDITDTFISINQRTKVNGTISYPNLIEPMKDLKDITIKAKLVQTSTGIGSIFSASNSSAQNDHFHIYQNGGSFGYEIRGDSSFNIGASGNGVRAGGLNTVAFKADSTTRTLKIFANGALRSEKTLSANDYKMISDITGIDAISIGSTPRAGNTYPFTGEILELEVTGKIIDDQELIDYTAQTNLDAEDGDGWDIFDGTGSTHFRIPALYTLQDGRVMAAIDARFGGPADSPNNLDTGINFLDTKTGKWGVATLPNHFTDYTDEPGYVSGSASFIDPVIVQDKTGVIHMLVDAFPSGYGYPNAATGTGMKTVGGEKYLALTKNGNSVTNMNNFDHYIKDSIVYNDNGTATEYTVDSHFNLFKNGEPLYVYQKTPQGKQTEEEVPMNIFYADADFKVFGTSYAWITSSADGGETWSDPRILNDLKDGKERFFGAGPGQGHLIKNGKYEGRILIPMYDNGHSGGSERTSLIYSDDNGLTWKRGNRTTMANSNSPGKSSEAQMIEFPDGTIRLFARGNTGYVGYGDSHDGGVTFEPLQQDANLKYCGNCMVSFINYSGTIDGKPAVIGAMPEGGGRANGIIRIGLIEENAEGKYTINWKYRYEVNKGSYTYSCLTELPDGRVALLYETNPNNSPCTFTVYTIDELLNSRASQIKDFSFTSSLVMGEKVEVSITLQDKVVKALSELEDATLILEMKETELEDITLTFDRISEDEKTIFFKGQLPTYESDYEIKITIPEDNIIFLLTGKLQPISDDILVGVVSKTIDRTGLQQLISQHESKLKEDYTEESWTAFSDALVMATTVLEDVLATQEEIDFVHTALEKAVEGLVEKDPTDPTDPVKPIEPAKPSRPSTSGSTMPDRVVGLLGALTITSEYTKNLFDAHWAKAVASENVSMLVSVRAINKTHVTSATLDEIAKAVKEAGKTTIIYADYVKRNAVITRLYVEPSKIVGDLKLTINTAREDHIEKLFNKYFINNLQVLSLDADNFTGKAAVKLDDNLKEIKNLALYKYNSETNTYALVDRNISVDKNGYARFEIKAGQNFIISDSLLTK